ncbi:cytochrome d ubiquinol oxidase subunit II [Actinacidiphila paucisporea]|uniref:Cytochrome bd-I ubiquinol oxidase subunit 2 apoprotein n=1 Tax=Actinacidiphila paucisporea TaxID=310782 RepID=A0A1M7CHW0_9ACTN|nr:cytochrome d ubiquinol oxidase subunit II [Actinacidiphila paucisporea]SHL66774.1 cytochrome bd-I ubiquinol oxidase subunit 2 apoprotein [Actinacidiphila paucisporea]
MHLHDVWFVLIAVLWTGYFFLEGFDFGIGVLTKLLARDRAERRVLINTIGPVWDGNEVWLLTAGGATFAAFPDWYATLFSGFYLPLLVILVCLIVRGVAFEYRAKRDDERWQRNWEHAIFWTSLLPAFLWGVAFADMVHGVKIDAHKEYVGGLWDLLHGYALLGGLVTLALFTFHGAVFASLKTVGPIRERARAAATRIGAVAAVLALAFLIWTQADSGNGRSLVALIVAALALALALGANAAGREGWSFAFSGVTIAATVALFFLSLFPDVMPSSLDSAWSLTVSNASATPYTLRIMTWCAAIATPLVLLYQGWTYWVFRKRIGTQHIAAAAAQSAERPLEGAR